MKILIKSPRGLQIRDKIKTISLSKEEKKLTLHMKDLWLSYVVKKNNKTIFEKLEQDLNNYFVCNGKLIIYTDLDIDLKDGDFYITGSQTFDFRD